MEHETFRAVIVSTIRQYELAGLSKWNADEGGGGKREIVGGSVEKRRTEGKGVGVVHQANNERMAL